MQAYLAHVSDLRRDANFFWKGRSEECRAYLAFLNRSHSVQKWMLSLNLIGWLVGLILPSLRSSLACRQIRPHENNVRVCEYPRRHSVRAVFPPWITLYLNRPSIVEGISSDGGLACCRHRKQVKSNSVRMFCMQNNAMLARRVDLIKLHFGGKRNKCNRGGWTTLIPGSRS